MFGFQSRKIKNQHPLRAFPYSTQFSEVLTPNRTELWAKEHQNEPSSVQFHILLTQLETLAWTRCDISHTRRFFRMRKLLLPRQNRGWRWKWSHWEQTNPQPIEMKMWVLSFVLLNRMVCQSWLDACHLTKMRMGNEMSRMEHQTTISQTYGLLVDRQPITSNKTTPSLLFIMGASSKPHEEYPNAWKYLVPCSKKFSYFLSGGGVAFSFLSSFTIYFQAKYFHFLFLSLERIYSFTLDQNRFWFCKYNHPFACYQW